MAILTVAQLREHIQTSLPDTAIQRLLDDAEADIIRFAGAPGSVVELIDGGTSIIVLKRPAVSITQVREVYGTPFTLAANDYRLRGPYLVERLATGTNVGYAWASQIEVTYTASDDAKQRVRVQVDLVKLELAFSGLLNNAIEGWAEGFGDKSIAERRGDILASLREPGMVVI